MPEGFPVEPLPLATVLGTAFLAGLARGFSGFGAALIFVPVASATLGPALAATILLIADGLMALPLVPGAARRCPWRDVLVMAGGAIVGVPLGAWLLTRSDPLAVRWAVTLLILLLLGVLASGWRYRGRPAPALTGAVGISAGFLSGIAQVGGPPIVVYWLGGALPAATVRANIVVYFAISSLLSAVSYAVGGLFTWTALLLAGATAPLYAAGLWLGARMFGIADERTFRRVCFGLIALAAVTGMPLLDGLWR